MCGSSPPTELCFLLLIIRRFSMASKSQSFEFNAALLYFSHLRSFVYLASTLYAFMGHLSNGQIILVLFTTASHITLCLRFRDIHFYRYVSYFALLGNFSPPFTHLPASSYIIMDMMTRKAQCVCACKRDNAVKAYGFGHCKKD